MENLFDFQSLPVLDLDQKAGHFQMDKPALAVCFLDRWPQTKCRVTFDTVSDKVFYALSHGILGFALLSSFFNHFLIGENPSTANSLKKVVIMATMESKTEGTM